MKEYIRFGFGAALNLWLFRIALGAGVAIALPGIVLMGNFSSSDAHQTSAVSVEVTVWQRVSDGALYLSTRHEGGSWTTHQTPLDMSQFSASGNFRQGSAITVEVSPVGRVSVSGTGPGTHPFVLPEGFWRCGFTEPYFVGNIFATLQGEDGWGEEVPWDMPFVLVGAGGGDAVQMDSVTSIEIDAASMVDWTFTCNRRDLS